MNAYFNFLHMRCTESYGITLYLFFYNIHNSVFVLVFIFYIHVHACIRCPSTSALASDVPELSSSYTQNHIITIEHFPVL